MGVENGGREWYRKSKVARAKCKNHDEEKSENDISFNGEGWTALDCVYICTIG